MDLRNDTHMTTAAEKSGQRSQQLNKHFFSFIVSFFSPEETNMLQQWADLRSGVLD